MFDKPGQRRRTKMMHEMGHLLQRLGFKEWGIVSRRRIVRDFPNILGG